MTPPPNLSAYWRLLKDLSTEEKLSLIELLVQSLRAKPEGRSRKGQQQATTIPADRQAMLDYILSYTNPDPNFGDAATWQRIEREDRDLPERK